MKTFFSLMTGLSLCWIACQSPKTIPEPNPVSNAITSDTGRATPFPEGWLGVYKGTMVLGSVRGADSVPVQLEVSPTDSINAWLWRMTYYGKPPMDTMVKDYRIVKLDNGKKGYNYIMDEGGGLELAEYYVADVFYSFFSMKYPDGTQMMLNSTLRRIDENELLFEVVSVPMAPVDTLKDYGIYNHRVFSAQRVSLIKQK